MVTAVEQLTGMAGREDRFTYAADELEAVQIQAMNERFQERKQAIKLLKHRAEEAGIDAIRSFDDMVPLLFPHTAYKSYPENFLAEGKWDRLTKWLGTVSAYPIDAPDTASITGIDDWIEQLSAKGHPVSCTSGTTGKPAMLIASPKDTEWWKQDVADVFSWGSGVQKSRDRRIMGLAPVAHTPKNLTMGAALEEAFGDPEREHYRLNVPPITVGQLTKMVVLRKKMTEGTAQPEELVELERTGKERQESMSRAIQEAAEMLVSVRTEKLMVSGMWTSLYQTAMLVRQMGYDGEDFNPDNCIYVGGGLKGAELPSDYQDVVLETFNIPKERNFQMYGMQEINSGMPRCREGNRYHIPPWLVPLVLNEGGDQRVARQGTQIEGRAAFFDLSQDGSWGGVISGDKISIDYGPCACGHTSPSIRDDIARYTDLKDGDDKIACSGTVDAYVRGVS